MATKKTVTSPKADTHGDLTKKIGQQQNESKPDVEFRFGKNKSLRIYSNRGAICLGMILLSVLLSSLLS